MEFLENRIPILTEKPVKMFQVLLPQQQQQLQPQQRNQPPNLQPHGIMKKLSNGKEFQLGLLPLPNIKQLKAIKKIFS